MGSGEIGLPTLRWLAHASEAVLVGVVTQPDKPVGRSQILSPPPPKKLAATLGLPILQPTKVRRVEELDRILELSPDLIVVMAYGQILPKMLLEMPKLACLNLHASILPRHRGAAPIQASILAGDRITGLTVMYMAEGWTRETSFWPARSLFGGGNRRIAPRSIGRTRPPGARFGA